MSAENAIVCENLKFTYPDALAALLVTFGGGCVLVQQLGFLTRAGVKTLPFLGVKALQGIVAALVALGLSALIL